MARRRALPPLVTLLSILTVAAPAAQSEGVKHSGTIIAVDRQAGAIVLAEVGPWLVRQGETVITRRTVTITDATTFVRIERMPEAPSGFAGDFVERAEEPWAVRSGDFVTVETTGPPAGLIAAKVAVVTVPAR